MYLLKVQRVYIVSDLGLYLYHSFLLETYSDFSSANDISQETLVLKGIKLQGRVALLELTHRTSSTIWFDRISTYW